MCTNSFNFTTQCALQDAIPILLSKVQECLKKSTYEDLKVCGNRYKSEVGSVVQKSGHEITGTDSLTFP